MKDMAEKIKALFLDSKFSVFGMARASLLEDEPSGYRPSDLLPGARTILCVGTPFPRGIFMSPGKEEQTYWRSAAVYYRHMDAILLQAAGMIEEDGEMAVPVYGCFPYHVQGWGDFRGYLSLVKAAVAAGIGSAGKNGLLFNSRYGSRLLLGGIVTTAPFMPASYPEKDDKGCPADCHVCRERCPVQAIDRAGRVDRVACLKHSMKSPIYSHLVRTVRPGFEDLEMINHVTGVDDHSWYTCIKCVSTCPY
jgi:epoxyqueuosine reductase QueG